MSASMGEMREGYERVGELFGEARDAAKEGASQYLEFLQEMAESAVVLDDLQGSLTALIGVDSKIDVVEEKIGGVDGVVGKLAMAAEQCSEVIGDTELSAATDAVLNGAVQDFDPIPAHVREHVTHALTALLVAGRHIELAAGDGVKGLGLIDDPKMQGGNPSLADSIAKLANLAGEKAKKI